MLLVMVGCRGACCSAEGTLPATAAVVKDTQPGAGDAALEPPITTVICNATLPLRIYIGRRREGKTFPMQSLAVAGGWCIDSSACEYWQIFCTTCAPACRYTYVPGLIDLVSTCV